MTRRLSVMPEVKDVGHEVLGSTERAKLRANANFATFSPFGASTITSRSCGLWRMHAVGRQFGLASAPKIAHWVQTMRVVRTSIARPPPPANSISHLGREKPISLMPIFSGPRKNLSVRPRAVRTPDRAQRFHSPYAIRLRQRMCSSHIRNSPKADDRPATLCAISHSCKAAQRCSYLWLHSSACFNTSINTGARLSSSFVVTMSVILSVRSGDASKPSVCSRPSSASRTSPFTRHSR
jgi:hypothetical protein